MLPTMRALTTIGSIFKGAVLSRSIVLDPLNRYRSPAGLCAAGKSGVKRWLDQARDAPSILIDALFDALAEKAMNVDVTGR